MRKKQVGPELKLFELDTLKYITENNIRDSIYYVGIYPERMSPADVTFARKSGLLDSTNNEMRPSKIALHYILGAISFREYSLIMLSKQWIKTTDIGTTPPKYNEPLLPRLLIEIQDKGKISKGTFTQEMDAILSSKYAPVVLSNNDSLRYVKGLLLSSELISEDKGYFIINPLATAIVSDIITNKNSFKSPTPENEVELFWNSMKYGIFDIIRSENKKIYSQFYPNLI